MQDAIILGDRHSHLIAKMMEMAQSRQQTISHNLSNVNTPGYIRQDIDFGRQLREVLQAATPQGMAAVRPEVVEDHGNPARVDGNNVQAAGEMNEMMQNGLMYELLVKAFSTRTSILRMAMQGANG